MNVNDLIELRDELSREAERKFELSKTHPSGNIIRAYGAGLDEAVKRIQDLIDECDED